MSQKYFYNIPFNSFLLANCFSQSVIRGGVTHVAQAQISDGWKFQNDNAAAAKLKRTLTGWIKGFPPNDRKLNSLSLS